MKMTHFKHKRVGSNSLAGVGMSAFFSTSDAGKWMHILIQRQYNGGMITRMALWL